MFANHFLLKLLMTPLIIATATYVARRWGERIGGLIVGLPLTSAPVSIFFAVEQGQKFAASAALGALMGVIPVAVFCTGYVRNSRRFPWYLTALFSIGLYLVSILVISSIAPGLNWIVVLVPLALTTALLIVGRLDAGNATVTSPWWDLPLRMVIATTILLLITAGASTLGPKWSGLLSPFPIFTFVMATFSHSQGGPAAAWRLIRGVLMGLFSYTAFFLVVALLIEKASLLVVYPLAAVTALSINGAALAILIHRARLRAAHASLK